MKNYSTAAIAALTDGSAIVAGAVAILCDPPVRVFSGWGILTIDGEEFTGIGDRGLIKVTGAALGGTAQGLSLSLSGVDPEILPLLDADALRGAPVIVYRPTFDSSGTVLLDQQVYLRGRVDLVPVEETSAGEATITLNVETPARGLGRRGGRMRTDADQRLVKANDGGLRNVGYAAAKQLYWGGKPPATAAAATGGSFTWMSPQLGAKLMNEISGI